MQAKNIQHYSRLTYKSPSIVERVIRTVKKLLKKPVSEKGNADWLSELPSVIKKYNNSIQSSTEMTPIETRKQSNEKEVYSNFKDNRDVRKPKFNLGQLFLTADIKKDFSKGDSTNYRYKLYTITEIIHDSKPSYRIYPRDIMKIYYYLLN